MSEDNLNNGHNSDVRFEPEDLSARPIITGLIVLGLVCVASYFIVLWIYTSLDRYYAIHQSGQNPLAAVQNDTRHVTKTEIEEFPQPRLEEDERGQLDGVRMKEENTLNSYGWVDEGSGVIHIPIQRAMKLVAEQSLPAQPSNAQSAPQKSNAAPALKAPQKAKSKSKTAGSKQ
jgi:hypothetical protein